MLPLSDTGNVVKKSLKTADKSPCDTNHAYSDEAEHLHLDYNDNQKFWIISATHVFMD